MKRFWQAATSVAVGSVMGFAFYTIANYLLYAYRQSTNLKAHDPLHIALSILTLPTTAAASLAMHWLIRRAFGSR
jgi:hypothetical protein